MNKKTLPPAPLLGLLLLALAIFPGLAHAQGLYLVGEAGFAAIESDIEAEDAVRGFLDDDINPVDDNGFRAALGLGYSTSIPAGIYLGVEASAARSFLETESEVEISDIRTKLMDAGVDANDLAKVPTEVEDFIDKYDISEEWRFAVSADVGIPLLLPGLTVFARVTYAETDEDISRAAGRAVITAGSQVDCNQECVDVIEDVLGEEASEDSLEADDLSGEEIGVGLLFHAPFTPLSVRGIITVEPETAFSVAVLLHF